MSSARIRIFRQHLSSRVLPVWTILLADILIIALSTLLAYCLRYGFTSIIEGTSTVDSAILWAVVVNLIFFRIFRTYSNVLRFSSFVDIMRIFVSVTAAYASLMVLCLFAEGILDKKPASVGILFMSYIISFAFMSCSRILVKTVFDTLNFDSS